MSEILHRKQYSDRLGASAYDKLKILDFIEEGARRVLDVGCNDGRFTLEMGRQRPDIGLLGIDIDKKFIEEAIRNRKRMGEDSEEGVGASAVYFEPVYLRDLLAYKDEVRSYDAVVFASTLHEFYSYGEGISSVLKALADAHELLKEGGVIIIRDMVLPGYTRHTTDGVPEISKRIEGALKGTDSQILFDTFTSKGEDYGRPSTVEELNHYLLKSLYEDNWEHEKHEDYTAISFEDYEAIFRLLGMQVEFEESYLLPYLAEVWRKRFGLLGEELRLLRSTGVIVARK